MRLIWKSEFLFLPHIVNVCSVLIFLNCFFARIFIFLCFNRFYFLNKEVVFAEKLVSINSSNNIDRDIRGLMFKTTMNINIRVNWPTCMSESLKWVEFVPFRWLSIINFKRYYLTYLISATSNNHHKWSKEKSRMLISWSWLFSRGFIWGFNPIPSSVSMSSQAPAII